MTWVDDDSQPTVRSFASRMASRNLLVLVFKVLEMTSLQRRSTFIIGAASATHAITVSDTDSLMTCMQGSSILHLVGWLLEIRGTACHHSLFFYG